MTNFPPKVTCWKMDKSRRQLQNAKDNWDGCTTMDTATCSPVIMRPS